MSYKSETINILRNLQQPKLGGGGGHEEILPQVYLQTPHSDHHCRLSNYPFKVIVRRFEELCFLMFGVRMLYFSKD